MLDPQTIPTKISNEDREVFLKIVHRPDRKLITVLKLLSPANTVQLDIVIDLAEVYSTAFDLGRYARSVDYRAPLDLPLEPETQTWAEETARAFRA